MTKLKKTILGVLGVGVVSAAGIAMLTKDDLTVAPITFNGEVINFTWTDDNTNENAIIYTDKKDYYSWGDTYAYLAIKNISPNDQNFDVQVWGNSSEKVSTVEEYKPHQAYQVDVQDFGSANLSCPGPDTWTATTTYGGTYACGKSLETCASVTKGVCTVENRIVSTHKETRYRDEWGMVIKSDHLTDYANKNIKVAPAQFKAKDQFQYWIPSGQTKYFRVKLNFNQLSKGEFYVKAFGSLGAYGNLDPSWYSNSWGYRMAITIDYTKVGTTTAVTGFPILISTTSPTLAFTGSGGHVGKSDGTDIVITDSDGTTKLSHEIEKYSSSTGETIIWAKYTGTLSTSTNTTLYVYYGNSGAADQQDTLNVWDSSYKAVYHFPNGTALTVNDSTGNYNLTKSGTIYPATGQIDGAASATSTGGFAYNSSASALTFASNDLLTIEAWVKRTDGSSNYRPIIALTRDGATSKRNFELDFNGGGVGETTTNSISYHYRESGDVSWQAYFHTSADSDTSAFHYYAFTYKIASSTTAKLYKDGQSIAASWAGGGGGVSPISDSNTLVFANIQSTANETLAGVGDEIRVSKGVNRSAAWFLTSYNNQSSPGTFMTWGTEESATPATVPSLQFYKGNGFFTGNVYAK